MGRHPVTGNIVFNGKATVTGVKEPSSDSDVATKGYVDRQNSIKSVTLTAAGWTGTTAPYTQAVKVDGITEDDNPVMVSMLAAGATLIHRKPIIKLLELFAQEQAQQLMVVLHSLFIVNLLPILQLDLKVYKERII